MGLIMKTNLQKFLGENCASEELVSVILDLSKACVDISELIRNGGGSEGKIGEVNASGEEQIAMDVKSNDIVIDFLKKNKNVGVYASEELEDEIKTENGGKYGVAFDPLDGSSLADANLAVGSIFGIYEAESFFGVKGRDQVGAMFAVYGPRLSIVLSVGRGTHYFEWNGESFELLHKGMSLDLEKKYFAPGNLKATVTEEGYLKLMEYWMLNEYKLRYSGGMVPDINHLFVKGGGIFCYPGFVKAPQGKLRVLYECAPMAFLVEQADGVAYAEKGRRILDIQVDLLAQRSPIFIGSDKEVQRALMVISE